MSVLFADGMRLLQRLQGPYRVEPLKSGAARNTQKNGGRLARFLIGTRCFSVDFQFFEQSTADGAMPSREDESDITYLAGQTYSNPDLNRIHYMHNLTTSVQES